jgi:Sugar phosphate isomerases/epimerases
MIGISTFCLSETPLDAALSRLRAVTDRIEIMDEGLHRLADPDLLASYPAHYSVHAPFHGLNIASVFEPIRRASIGILADCFSAAAEINAPVVIHPGYFAWANEREAAMRQFRQSCEDLAAAAREYSAAFSFENMAGMNFFLLRTPEDLESAGPCGLTLDVGHAHLNGCLPQFLAGPFCHLHLHDNNGKTDSHSPVGDGTIDFLPVLAAMRERKATAVVEISTFDGAVASLRALERM